MTDIGSATQNPVDPIDLIRRKRDGERLDDDQIRAFIAAVTTDAIADYQVAAMLMAVFLRGLDDREAAVWTDAMVHSGEVVDLSGVARPKVDKHSTGGVGDKISLPLAPAVAACGGAVPMISGRGLGHTGGTLDKLESIPGFSVGLSVERFVAQVADIGAAIIGQTEKLAPADRRLYAMRDVTATIESIPLIAASILSKKLAAGIDSLVLDCKVGQGAFMKTRERARALGQAIRGIGQAAGKNVAVVITEMDTPIGRAVGNALEVAESIEVLRGGGPPDTRELTIRLGAEMLRQAGLASGGGDGGEGDGGEGERAIARALDSGAALDVFRAMIAAQDGDPRVVDDPALLPRARHQLVVTAPQGGRISAIEAMPVARAGLALGAGRQRKEDAIDPAVGVEITAPLGAVVSAGDELARIHHNDRGVDRAHALVAGSFTIDPDHTGSGAADAAASRILEVLR